MKIVQHPGKISLKNENFLEMVFLGVGTAFSKKNFNNNMLLIKGDTHILVDFGYNAPYSLEKNTGLKPTDIEVFLPTHSHADHIGGVEYLALLNRYIGTKSLNKPKLKLITTEDYVKVFWNYSLRGGLEWNEASKQKKMTLEDYFDIVYAEPHNHHYRNRFKIKFGEIDLEIFGTNHIPDDAKTQKQAFTSYGLMIDKRIMYSSDTKFDESLLDMYADDAEIIFHDCSFDANPVHASINELKKLPDKWRKKMYLMHYQDDWEDKDCSDFAGLARPGVRYIFD